MVRGQVKNFRAMGLLWFVLVVAILYGSEVRGAGEAEGKGESAAQRKRAAQSGTALAERLELLPKVRKKARLGAKMKRLKNGTLRFFYPGFNADVLPNGQVRFGKKSLKLITEGPPMHPRGRFGDRVMGAFDGFGADTRSRWVPGGTGGSSGGTGGSLGSNGDLTEVIMHAKGQDPYAGPKLRFLDRTRQWRRKLQKRARGKTIRRYLKRLPGRLRRIWQNPDLTVGQKKNLFFALWDECLEPDGTSEGKWAQKARTLIIAFVQQHLPPQSDVAYTARELAGYAVRRKGKKTFSPYADQGVASPPQRD